MTAQTIEHQNPENTIEVNRGIYIQVLTESEVSEFMDQNSALKSILLMVLNNEESWENAYEVEFSRQDAVDYLKKAKVFKGYSKKYINESLTKILKKIIYVHNNRKRRVFIR